VLKIFSSERRQSQKTLDLKEPQQNLGNLKRQSRKAQNKKAKQILGKEIKTKLEKETNKKNAHKKTLRYLLNF